MKRPSMQIGLGIALGAGIGAALAVALGSGSAWLGIGIAIGVAPTGALVAIAALAVTPGDRFAAEAPMLASADCVLR